MFLATYQICSAKDGQRAAQLHPVPNGPSVVDLTDGPFTLRKSNNGSSVG
ncbi:MAG: hypothetical protein JWM11_5360 [Planctomycetaceae bacterium]|nr:hypothetical protein [Planctomycetaceae bacterium]